MTHDYDHDGFWRHHHDVDTNEAVWWTNVDQFGGTKKDHVHALPPDDADTVTFDGRIVNRDREIARFMQESWHNDEGDDALLDRGLKGWRER